MMYCEFIEGTGCKDTEKNYKVFKDFEVMYMNSDMTKAEIYEYGKKLVDNSKTESELKVEKEMNERIEELKKQIADEKAIMDSKQEFLELFKADGDKEMVRFYRNTIKSCKERLSYLKKEIAGCKWVLGC